MSKKEMFYTTNTLALPAKVVQELTEKRVIITRQTLIRNVSLKALRKLESLVGYASKPSEGNTMANDLCVIYFKSFLQDEVCYGISDSLISYLFTKRS